MDREHFAGSVFERKQAGTRPPRFIVRIERAVGLALLLFAA
jgi:hypothetical protein